MKLVDSFEYKGRKVSLYEVPPEEREIDKHGNYHQYRAFINEEDVTNMVLHSGELPKWGHYAKELIDNTA